MSQFTLYGPALSTYVRTVRMLLETTNTPYELAPVDIFSDRDPAYLAKNPFGKVPTLTIDGDPLYETSAIVAYLDAVVGNGQFTPTEPLLRARMQQIMAIIDNYLYPPAIQTITIQRLIVPSQGGQTDEAAVQAAVPKVQTALQAIAAIAACNPYLLGGQVTLADLYLLPVVLYLSKTPEMDTVMADVPTLQTWWQTASQLPSFVAVT